MVRLLMGGALGLVAVWEVLVFDGVRGLWLRRRELLPCTSRVCNAMTAYCYRGHRANALIQALYSYLPDIEELSSN